MSVYDVANAVGPYQYSDPGVRPKAVRKVETPCRLLLSRRWTSTWAPAVLMWFGAWNCSEAFRSVQRLARKAGVDGQISPHSLRRPFATIALDNGAALHDLQDSLGQADPRTTRRYDRSRHKLAKSAGYDVARALA